MRKLLFSLIGALLLAGCKETLYSNLDERQANEMVAVLAVSNIESWRSRDKKNIYEISVDRSDVAQSILVLKNQGLPRESFLSLGDVFSADGIIGTPFEQHARFIHAMNQELSRTISEIPGVRSARVFVTSPPKTRYERTDPPASASVAIRYDTSFDPGVQVSKIKMIVAHSLKNLNYDDVVVALFKIETPSPALRANLDYGVPGADSGVILGSVLPAIDWFYSVPNLAILGLGFATTALLGFLLLQAFARRRRK